MTARTLTLLAAILSTAAAPLSAQASIAGTWTAVVPDAVKNEDGVQSVISTTTATLVLEMRGDSVVGTFKRLKSPVARAIAGTVSGATVVLHANTQARMILNGEEQTLALITTYRFTLDGYTLRGTSETKIDPASKPPTMAAMMATGVEQSPVPVTATRVKG